MTTNILSIKNSWFAKILIPIALMGVTACGSRTLETSQVQMSKKSTSPQAAEGAASTAPAAVTNMDDPHNGPWIEKPINGKNELVMAEGMKLVAQSNLGELTIVAGKGFNRTYTWDDGKCTRSVEHWPRSERWYGSYGIYYPGPGHHWQKCNNITRGVLQEGQMHFASEENAMKWIAQQKFYCTPESSDSCDLIYSKDGLLVSFGKNLSRGQLNVDLFQIYINDKKPENLPGAVAGIELK